MKCFVLLLGVMAFGVSACSASDPPSGRTRRDSGPGGGDDGGGPPVPRCGDGTFQPPGEECDDGNTSDGDGCSAMCTVEAPTAFRIDSLALISPRIVVDVPLDDCRDLTQEGTSVFGMDVDPINRGLNDSVATPDGSGRYSSNLVQVFRPLSPMSASTVLDVDTLGMDGCMAGSPTSCMLGSMPMVQMTTAMNMPAGGTCFTPDASQVNAPGASAYAPSANTVTGPCYVSGETTYIGNVSGTALPLTHARISAQYSAGRLTGGTITGFLTEAQAMSIVLPSSIEVVGGMPLYSILQAGGAPGSACNVNGGLHEDDRDADPDNPSLRGFWFFLNFTASEVTWGSP